MKITRNRATYLKRCIDRLAIACLLFTAVAVNTVALAQDRVVVVPLGGDDPTGNATEADVLAGKTFSNATGINKVGTLELSLAPSATTVSNSIGMQFNLLPAGSFTMGSPASEPGRSNDEIEHTVTFSQPFQIQTTEVTNAHWNSVIVDSSLGINPSSNPAAEDHPIEGVSWYDAVFFANRLSTNEGRSPCYRYIASSGAPGNTMAGNQLILSGVSQNANCTGYRLPTEAEWEYAARAGTSTAYANPVGFDDEDNGTEAGFNGNLHAMGWYTFNNANMGYSAGPKPIAKKQANAWGLYDMHGNVIEWTWDWYSAYSGDVTDPTGPAFGTLRVIRGGSWFTFANLARSAQRNQVLPTFRFFDVGFRLVLSGGA